MTRFLGAAVLGLALALAACSGGGSSPTATPVVSRAASAASAATAVSAGGSATTVSANTATQDELAAALEAAGVPNADRWAREVIEYRPDATDDTTLQELQDNLAKYNPDPTTLAAILAALTP